MKQFYRIQPVQDTYRYFELDAYDFLDKMGEEFEISDFGKPIQHAWRPIKAKYFSKIGGATTIPDITTYSTDMLALNQKAYDVLKATLEAYGELLPILVDDETYYLYNVTTRLPDDVIDFEKSEYEYVQEELAGLKTLIFAESKVAQDIQLFCVQNEYAYNIYCDDRLKNLVEENGLGGICFNPTLIDPYFT